MNITAITGHLTRDPELHSLGESAKQVCSMRVAIDNGQYDADYVDVKVFGASAPNAARYLSKGSRVEVDGRLRSEQWETEGQKRSKVLVVANRVKFPPKGSNGASPSSEEPGATAEPVGAASGSDGEIPF